MRNIDNGEGRLAKSIARPYLSIDSSTQIENAPVCVPRQLFLPLATIIFAG
jgi:hypothetical protein